MSSSHNNNHNHNHIHSLSHSHSIITTHHNNNNKFSPIFSFGIILFNHHFQFLSISRRISLGLASIIHNPLSLLLSPNHHSLNLLIHQLSSHELKPLFPLLQSPFSHNEIGFPKGRRHNDESEFKCALREFYEETGFPPHPQHHPFVLIDNVLPFEETFLGSNNKIYKHKYFITPCY